MPSIMATPYPDRGHVLIDVNYADVPTAVSVCVTATDTVTGLVRPLHAYVSYNSDGCINLSCGQAILWDTEINCDNPTVYCATGVDAAGAQILEPAEFILTDTFTRNVVAGFGTADTGQLYTTSGGAAADYTVNGTRGQMAVTSTNVVRFATVPGPETNAEFAVTIFPNAVALTQPFSAGFAARATVAGDGIFGRVVFGLAGALSVELGRTIAGVDSSGGPIAIAPMYTALSAIRVVWQIWGDQLRIRAFDATGPDPGGWQTTLGTSFAAPTSGRYGLRAKREAGNTNGTINVQFDNFRVSDVCAEPTVIEVCTEEVTIECDGCFRLGNPVRPCDDVRVCLCADGVACGGTGGLAFISMTPDTRVSNTGTMVPVNDSYPIVVNRRRMKPNSNLTIVATSFAARDELIDLLEPGEPLLLRTTPDFGIGSRYLTVGDVPELYELADMTSQPRILQLPNGEVRPSPGPSLGVCGSRVMDLCDIYATWDEMVAAGLTWADLLRGEASPPGSGLATWADINAQNANWAALQVAETDWSDVLDGD